MSNATASRATRPYGQGGRVVELPVKATSQIYQGTMVAQIAGACVAGTTALAGQCIGVAMHDQLGGAADGSKRLLVLTGQAFIFPVGTAAPTDATPFGTPLYMEDDHTIGTGGLGATQQPAGKFMGLEDDSTLCRVFVSDGLQEAASSDAQAVNGTALTDTATTTIQRVGRVSRYLLAGTMTQDETVTIGTTGAVLGDRVHLVRTSVSAHTLAVVNGGTGAGTLCTLVASKIGFANAYFDGTNWVFDGCSAT